MSGGSGRVRTGGGPSRQARVENERLWVDAQISGGGGGIAANVTIVGPLPVPVDIVSSITLPVLITGQPISVTGVVAISGPVTVTGTVAVSSVIPGTGATNLGKAHGQVFQAGDVGVMPLSLISGVYSPLQSDAAGRLNVSLGSGATSIGKTEETAHVSGDIGVMQLAVRQDVIAPLAVNGSYIPHTTDNLGRLNVTLGVGTTSVGKAEDAPHASGDVGVMSLAVRQDTLAALAANGDYIPLTTDALGRLRVLAMEPYTVLPLSSSTNGRPIVVDTTGFVAIHTVAALSVDTITIYATNIGTTDRTIYLGWGGTGTGDTIYAFVPAGETVVVASEYVANATVAITARLNVAGTVRVVGQVVRRAV